ncbi:MAG: 50S ribosomal protein L22 [Planctomycetales bacterium]
MPFTASHRYARISARKVRPLADLIRGRHADEALELLKVQHQRGARLLEQVLRSAVANAEDRRSADVRSLIVTDARVDGAAMLKRIRPRARGMAYGILKRSSHISVTLD